MSYLDVRRAGAEPLIRVDRRWRHGVNLWVITADKLGDNAPFAPDPDYVLTEQDAQVLIDDLWRAGLRPTEGSGSAGSLAATERHLKEISGLLHQVLPIALGGR
jgi:hypothetical protein